jgi:acyl transferase domain-containing protein
VVTGHSAGEVPAAYAAGHLTLEEAVQVVYHRSQEQQKMAGCGRLLVVGMPHEKMLEFIKYVPGWRDDAVCVGRWKQDGA